MVLSPHTGYVVKEMMESWYEEQVENVEGWLKGGEGELKDRIAGESSGYGK